ncbi:hypothetical protein [Rhodococcoides corynebacterioides]|uniref:Uncharacterized protein n=1 Tax=Rhodococcoides corynebacterioides TaxID=53972 RepID=A0ABS7P8E8_9NOCA|nr:hypothetical protein [Rhodococcus corynebacterioides]MBY6368605.1 hypothetical protein [Rhodococcus corynebacterioides]MBY6409578.1 hypothetical protein [Rhodococcus corynebacterioides]
MIVLLVVAVVWVAFALAVAVVVGRSVHRADQEELGSENTWDITAIEDAPHRSA